jgi:hypothetical protein
MRLSVICVKGYIVALQSLEPEWVAFRFGARVVFAIWDLGSGLLSRGSMFRLSAIQHHVIGNVLRKIPVGSQLYV